MSIAGKRFIGVAEEATFGTPVAAEEYIKAASASLIGDQSFLYPETGAAGREETPGIPGPYKTAGPFAFPINAQTITKPLKWLLGDYGAIGEPKLEAAGGDTTLDEDIAAGVTVIPVAATTDFAVDDFIHIGQGKLLEVRRVTVVNTGVSLEGDKATKFAHNGTTTPEKVRELDLGTQIDVESASGQKVLNVDDETGFAADQYIMVGDHYNAECCKVASTGSGTITVVDNLIHTHAIDENVVQVTGVAFLHRFRAGSSIQSFTIEDCPGIADKSRQFAGCVAKSCEFSAPKADYISASMETVHKKPKLIDSTVPTLAQLNQPRTFVFYEDVVTLADETAPKVSAWTGTYENTIDEENFVHGDRFLEGIVLGGSNFEGSLELVFRTWPMHQRFWGSKTKTEPDAGEVETYLIRFDFLGLAITGAESGGKFDKYELDINMPNVELQRSEPAWERRETITQVVNWKASVKDEVYAVEFCVVNAKYRP